MSLENPTHPNPPGIPEWLASLIYDPPLIVEVGLWVVFIAVAIAVAKRVYRRGVSLEAQREMQIVLGTVVGVLLATLYMTAHDGASTIIDLSVGVAAGYGIVLLAQTPLVTFPAGRLLPEQRRRRNAAWAIIGVAAYVLPLLIPHQGSVIPLNGGRIIAASIGAGMIIYNMIERSEERDGRASAA